MAATLGELRPIDPRSMWWHKAADFKPWLAAEDNTERLSADVGRGKRASV